MKTFNDVIFSISKFPKSSGIIGNLQISDSKTIKIEMTETSIGYSKNLWSVSLFDNNNKIKEFGNLTNKEMQEKIIELQ